MAPVTAKPPEPPKPPPPPKVEKAAQPDAGAKPASAQGPAAAQGPGASQPKLDAAKLGLKDGFDAAPPRPPLSLNDLTSLSNSRGAGGLNQAAAGAAQTVNSAIQRANDLMAGADQRVNNVTDQFRDLGSRNQFETSERYRGGAAGGIGENRSLSFGSGPSARDSFLDMFGRGSGSTAPTEPSRQPSISSQPPQQGSWQDLWSSFGGGSRHGGGHHGWGFGQFNSGGGGAAGGIADRGRGGGWGGGWN